MAQDIPRTTIVRYNVRLVATSLLTALLAFASAAGAHFPGVAGAIQSQAPTDAQRIKRPTSKPYTYHEIAQPIILLSHLREAMRPGALMGIIDRNGNGKDHGISSKVVIKEAGEAGFTLVEQYDFVKPDGMDYFLVFRVRVAAPSH